MKSVINSKKNVLMDELQISSHERLENVPIDILARERLQERTVKESDNDEYTVEKSDSSEHTDKESDHDEYTFIESHSFEHAAKESDSDEYTVVESDSFEIPTESESDCSSEDEEWVMTKRKASSKKNVKNTTKPKKKKTEKTEKEDSDNDEMSSYEKMIEARRAEKIALLQSIGVNEAKAEFSKLMERPKRVSIKKPCIKDNLPLRKSRRLANAHVTVDYSEKILTDIQRSQNQVVHNEMSPEFSFKDAYQSLSRSDIKKQFIPYMKDLNVQKSEFKYEFFSYDRSIFQSMRLSPSNITEIVSSAITSSSWYPSLEKFIIASGDRYGHLGIWNVENDSKPHWFGTHTRKISHLQFNPYNSEQLVSSSFDCTVRCCDLVKQMFDKVYDNYDECDCTYLDILSSTTYLVSQSDGKVTLIDTLSKWKNGEKTHKCHDYSINTVNIHPLNRNVFVTAESDNCVRVWDLRKLQQRPLVEITHTWPRGSDKKCATRSVNSAFFSPVTGNSILTTALNDSICIFKTTYLLQEAKLSASLVHNNNTVSPMTMFRAMWLPNSEEAFIVGSREKKIQIFDKNMNIYYTVMDEKLNSISPVNALHPYRPALAANSSSGKVFVFI